MSELSDSPELANKAANATYSKEIRLKVSKVLFLGGLLASIYGHAIAADCVSGATISSSTTCTVPAGATNVTIQAWGGGGAW